jgi:hypothetical protein
LPTSIFSALLLAATSISEEADETVSTIFPIACSKTVGDALHCRLAILLGLQLEPACSDSIACTRGVFLGNSRRCRPLKRIQT